MALNYVIIGKRIKEIRKHKHISQQTLSEMIDKSPTFIIYIESGIRSMSLETLVMIADVLNVSVDVLLGENTRNSQATVSNEFATVIGDCSDFERRVIIEQAKAIKKAMRDNWYLKKTWNR